MRVYELAKELKLTSKDLLDKLKEFKVPAKSHTSAIDEATQQRLRDAFAKPAAKVAAKPVKPAAKAKPASEPKPAEALARPAAPAVTAKTAASVAVAPPPAKKDVKAPKPQTQVAAAPAAQAPPAASPAPAQEAPAQAPPVEAPAAAPRPLDVRFPITVNDLAGKMEIKPAELIKKLIQQGVFASITQQLDEATAVQAAKSFGFEIAPQPTIEDQLLKACAPDPAKLVPRAPVVTFMGHVDHGKTSLLDAIREAKVAQSEAGGITQHIGAYEVQLAKGHVTFLDTPGHEAFSALRARGANATDVVVLVVAADDGVMPQTIEAINHAKAANVPIVVAMNKIDKPDANPSRIQQQLAQYELLSEEWGGKTIMVPVSAKTRQGIDQLLEMLLLEAELLELKADPTTKAHGVVIEAKHTKNRGPVATLLVQQGTLRIGEPILVGHHVGRVRALVDDRGRRLKEAGPAKPVEVLGLPEVPQAGDQFLAVDDERAAKQLADRRREQHAAKAQIVPKRITLQDLHQRIKEGQKELRLILKADAQGSLEAILQSLERLDLEKEEVSFRVLHSGTGDINESDVILSAASDAIIFGFHVGITVEVQVLAAKEGVDVHIYQIIYEIVNALKAAIEGLLEPTLEETFLGRAEVRKLFQISKVGMVAGCMVVKGAIRRDAVYRVIRGKERMFEGKLTSLKRVKDDAREVTEGTECGISLAGSVDLQVGDLIEAWEIKKVARKLG